MNKYKVLVMQALPEAGMALFRARPDVDVEVVPEGSEADLLARIGEADGITLRVSPFTARIIDAASRLRIASRFGVGYDSVDVPALTRRGIPLAIAGEANSVSVAEHALFLMLALAKQCLGHDRSVRDDNWGWRAGLHGTDLWTKTVLILGYGRIGRRTARRCLAFDMNTLVYDPYVDQDMIARDGAKPVADFRAVLSEVDFVTVHTPKTPETTGIIGRDELAAMKPTAFVINTARGGIVDEAALYDALKAGRIRGAGLDVFDLEPPGEHPLFALDNVILSPHIAGVTKEAGDRMAIAAAQNVLDAFDGRLNPDNVVNKEVLK